MAEGLKPRSQNVLCLPCPSFHPWLQSTTRCYDWCPHRRLQTRRPTSSYICFFAKTWETSWREREIHLICSKVWHCTWTFFINTPRESKIKSPLCLWNKNSPQTEQFWLLQDTFGPWNSNLFILINEMFFSFDRRIGDKMEWVLIRGAYHCHIYLASISRLLKIWPSL